MVTRRSEEKQAEIEELRAEVRRGEARLRTLHRDMKAQQDKAELHSKFSTQYLTELEDLRSKHAALQVPPRFLKKKSKRNCQPDVV